MPNTEQPDSRRTRASSEASAVSPLPRPRSKSFMRSTFYGFNRPAPWPSLLLAETSTDDSESDGNQDQNKQGVDCLSRPLKKVSKNIENKAKRLQQRIQLNAVPLGIPVYYYHCLGYMLLLGLIIVHRYIAMLIVALVWTVQLFSLVVCFITLSRPNYDSVRAKYDDTSPVKDLYEKNGVTILKPLYGIPERLRDNLETYFALSYPRFEIICCIKDKSDPVVELVKKLMSKYPNVDARISFGECDWGINPKLCNMGTGYKDSKYELIWIADANIVASDATIQDMVEKVVLDPLCGLCHQVPWMISGPGNYGKFSELGNISGGSVLDRWYFATGHARGYFFANALIATCLNGMSNMFRRSALEAIGGLKHYAQFIAEDAELGEALDNEGFNTVLSAHAGIQNLAETKLQTFIDRRVRWARLRYNMPVTAATGPFELLIECHLFPMLAIITLGLYHYGVGWGSTVFFVQWHSLGWLACDAIVFALLDRSIGLPEAWQDKPNNNLFFDWGKVSKEPGGLSRFLFNCLRHYLLWFAREITVIVIIIQALKSPSQIAWGGKKFRLRMGKRKGGVRQVPNSPKPGAAGGKKQANAQNTKKDK